MVQVQRHKFSVETTSDEMAEVIRKAIDNIINEATDEQKRRTNITCDVNRFFLEDSTSKKILKD